MNAPHDLLSSFPNLSSLSKGKKTIHGYENLEQYIKSILQETGDKTLIALTGIPGSGKSKMVDTLTENPRVLGEKKDPIILYNTSKETIYRGYNHDSLSVFHMEADWFFGSLGSERYNEMLHSFESFCRLYGDEATATNVMQHFFAGNECEIENIYGKTMEEKNEKKKKGSLLFVSPEHEKRVIVLDGTNAIELAEKVKQETSTKNIEVIKILLNPSLETSFMGILKRDILKNGKDIDTVIEFRLLEFFYIIKRWIIPALADTETVIFHPEKKAFNFDTSFIGAVTASIREKRNMLIKSIDNYEIQNFIYTFSKLLLSYLTEEKTKKEFT